MQVMEMKKALRQEEHNLKLQESALDENFLFSGDEKNIETQERLLELEAKQLQAQLKLKRTQLFGLRLAKGVDPHCVFCFVEHGELTQMVRIDPGIRVARLFKCARCGRELKLEPLS